MNTTFTKLGCGLLLASTLALTSQSALATEAECLDKYGTVYGWFGWKIKDGLGKSPKEIRTTAVSTANTYMAKIVQDNIAPWWSIWWDWEGPDNETNAEKIGHAAHAFTFCKIGVDGLEFPKIKNITGYSGLRAQEKENIKIDISDYVIQNVMKNN